MGRLEKISVSLDFFNGKVGWFSGFDEVSEKEEILRYLSDTYKEENPTYNSPYSFRDYEDAEFLAFVFDSTTYLIMENPDDGYRSFLDDIVIIPESVYSVKNRFKGQKVSFAYSNTSNNVQTMVMTDVFTQLPILEFGTDYSDSWYPYFICDYKPENMISNHPEIKAQKDTFFIS